LNAAAAHRVTTDSVAHPPPVSHGTSGAVLAFDFGEQRIGVAVGHTAVGIAHPLTTLHAPDKKTRYTAIAALIAEWRPALLVVGKREAENKTVAIRRLGAKDQEILELGQAVARLTAEARPPSEAAGPAATN